MWVTPRVAFVQKLLADMKQNKCDRQKDGRTDRHNYYRAYMECVTR